MNRQNHLMTAVEIAAFIAIVLGGWLQATVIGPMFDYGLVIQGSYGIEQGIWPHRDYTCSLQILTLVIARIFEKLLGASYLALGIANIVWALVFYFVLRYSLRGFLGRAATFVAFCLTLATVLQHGIIWYNTLGATLFILLLVLAAKTATETPKTIDWVLFVFFGVLLGMTKMNFHFGALACAGVIFLDQAIREKRLSLLVTRVFLLSTLVVAGPVMEMWVTGVGPSRWFYDVVQVGRFRFWHLVGFLDSWPDIYNLFLGIVMNFYPARWARGIPLFFLIAYTVGWFLISQRNWRTALLMIGSFICTIALLCTNFDIVILKSSAFMGALLFLLARERENVWVRGLVLTSALYLAFVSVPSIGKHSRLAFEPIEGPFTRGEYLHPYFKGTRVDAKRTLEIRTSMKLLSGIPEGATVFLGPGTNYLYRVFRFKPAARLPLWWDSGTAYSIEQIDDLRQEFFSCGFEAIVFNEWGFGIPQEIHQAIADKYLATQHEAKHLNILLPIGEKGETGSFRAKNRRNG